MNSNVKIICLVLSHLIYMSNVNAQDNSSKTFQRVHVPDSAFFKLEESYKRNTGFDSVNAGRNVWNLLESKDLILQNGIYAFKGQGPHFPRLLFIYDNNNLFVFSDRKVEVVLKEFAESIEVLKLSEKLKLKYLQVIVEYLEAESKE